VAESNLTAFEALTAQVNSFVAKRKVNIDVSAVKRALSHTTLKPAFGFWAMTVMDVLGKFRTAAQGSRMVPSGPAIARGRARAPLTRRQSGTSSSMPSRHARYCWQHWTSFPRSRGLAAS
jgi:hypothetical protein